MNEYLEPFSEMQDAFSAVHEELHHLDNPFAIGDRRSNDIACRICIGGGDIDIKYKVLEAITAKREIDFLNDSSGLGTAPQMRNKENLYFQYFNMYGRTVISLNLLGLMNSDVLCLGFKEDLIHFEKWVTSTEYDYLRYVKPWLKSKLIVVYGSFDERNPLFQGLTVMSYEGLCTFVEDLYNLSKSRLRELPISSYIADNWLDILESLGISQRSWFSDGGFIDSMTPVPIIEEDRLQPLLVGQSLITQGLYEYVMGSNPSRFKGSSELPVEQVSWFDLLHFCNRLSEMQGFRPCYYDIGSGWEGSAKWDRSANGYRLLTEREWEYVARANRTFEYSGSDDFNEVAWYDRNSGEKTHSVGTKKENSFGTYDQSGNLREWCWDVPTFESNYRVLRGGSWYDGASNLRAAYRNYDAPSAQFSDLGGRLARSPDPLIP